MEEIKKKHEELALRLEAHVDKRMDVEKTVQLSIIGEARESEGSDNKLTVK